MRYKSYCEQDMDKAIAAVLAGSTIRRASTKYNVPPSTLNDRTRKACAGVERQRPGPKPSIPAQIENDAVAWVACMQARGHPPKKKRVRMKIAKISKLVCNKPVTRHYMRRFYERHPELAPRAAQTINRARNAVDGADLDLFYSSLLNAVSSHDITADRIFNMDETAFDTRDKTQKVMALRGSRAVWSKTISTSFHLSLAVCGSASGKVLPPLFIFPGVELYQDLEECDAVQGSAVTTSSKGYMTERLLFNWLDMFSSSIDDSVTRPVLLIMDGYGSHMSERIALKADALKVLILFLPPNATHLVQPLDICVFGPFKSAVRDAIFDYMVENGMFMCDILLHMLLCGPNIFK